MATENIERNFSPGPIIWSKNAIRTARSARARRGVVAERQAREGCVEIDLRIVPDGLGPDHVEQPRAGGRHTEARLPRAIGYGHRERAFIGAEVGELDGRAWQATPIVEDMHRKDARRTQRACKSIGNKL